MEVWQLFLQRPICWMIYKLTVVEDKAGLLPTSSTEVSLHPLSAPRAPLMREVTALANWRQRFLLGCSVLVSCLDWRDGHPRWCPSSSSQQPRCCLPQTASDPLMVPSQMDTQLSTASAALLLQPHFMLLLATGCWFSSQRSLTQPQTGPTYLSPSEP